MSRLYGASEPRFHFAVSHHSGHNEIFTKANGWQSGNEYFADEDSWYHFLPGDEIQFTEAWADHTLPATFTFCAQWLPNILVQYDLNGGSGTTPASKTGMASFLANHVHT